MNLVDYEALKKDIIGKSVEKPKGELSGHAVGGLFEKYLFNKIKDNFPNDTFRQYEYLNYLYSKNSDTIGFKARTTLFNSPTVMFLLSRGKNATDKWSIENLFEEKQNDTADILIVKDEFFNIIDIKSRNLSKNAQSPNIISSYKLAQTCAKMIDNSEFDTFTIEYIQIDWLLEENNLVCKDVYIANLFKSNPSKLYINWTSGMQIQFHVSELDQSFDISMQEWAREYLKHFVTQAKKRADDMIIKFVTPFERYIK